MCFFNRLIAIAITAAMLGPMLPPVEAPYGMPRKARMPSVVSPLSLPVVVSTMVEESRDVIGCPRARGPTSLNPPVQTALWAG